MELKGKTFDINGDKKIVVNTDDDFAYFGDGARVKVDILLTKYEEVMDPNAFFNTESGLKGLAEDFEKIDTKAITEHHAPTSNVNNTGAPATTVIINGEEQEAQQVTTQPPVQKIDTTGLKPATNGGGDFFSQIKRNNEIEIDFKVSEKFPDLDFVRMMNDNYETSIIEHFAREIVEKMIYDPEALLESIKDRITEIVYGKDSVQLKETKQDSPYPKELEPVNDNTDQINKITEDRKVVDVVEEVEVTEEPTEEIATNVNDTIKEETNIEENGQETNKETGTTDSKPESEPQQEV